MEISTDWVDSTDGNVRLFALREPDYVSKVTKIPTDITFERFRSVRAPFGWVAHSLPDVCCEINIAALVTQKSFNKNYIEILNQAFCGILQITDLGLKYIPLHRDSLYLREYIDASFSSNDDSPYQLGYLIMIFDAMNRYYVLELATRKFQRVIRSIMAGEIYAFGEGFEKVFTIMFALQKIYQQAIPITMLTDSKQMFDAITKASHTTEKRLMIDITASSEDRVPS